MEESRQDTRTEIDGLTRCRIEIDTGRTRYGFIQNESYGGAKLIVSGSRLEVGDELNVILEKPAGQGARYRAVVSHIDGGGFFLGVRFLQEI